MRLVLDTNVLLAAFIARGVCHELLEHCEQEHELVTSAFILGEFQEKLVAKFKVPEPRARAAQHLIRSRSEVVEPVALAESVSRDPDDDWVVATAVAGRCACIVTGDKDLLSLNEYSGIQIVAPRDFWRYEASQSG